MLLYEVVIGPQRRNEEEEKACAQQDQERPHQKEEQRTPKQSGPTTPFGSIEVGTRKGAKNVRCVYENGPQRHHGQQRHKTTDIEYKERIAGNHGTNEPEKIVTAANDPTHRDRA